MAMPKGFAAMTIARRKAIARKGGIAVHAKGTAHEFDSDSGSRAARLARNPHRFTPAEASAAGKRGAAARWKKECVS